MAEEKRVQLKQEEVVGNEITLTDINPITDTSSVDDVSTGAPLNESMDRLWQAINGKLTRIVNSVNGRTGVVVLNSEDVGLGNVDNVSFTDIKKWVKDLFVQEFGNKRIYLAETLDEIDQLIASNDLKYRDKPFYSKYGYGTDKKAYIGYIAYNETEDRLEHEQMPIFTIGKPDNSVIYDEKVGTDPYKDKSGGGLGVNICKYEDALYLYNKESNNKDESGLKIDKSKIVGKFYTFDGVYGTSTQGYDRDPYSLLTTTTNPDAPIVYIYINDILIPGEHHLNYGYSKWETVDKLRVGDIIMCNFKKYYTYDSGDYVHKPIIPSGMSADLMGRRPALGMITVAPSDDNKVNHYEIRFSSITPNLGWGLKNEINHSASGTTSSTEPTDSEITFKLAKSFKIENVDSSQGQGHNMSGLQVAAHKRSDPALTTPSEYAGVDPDSLSVSGIHSIPQALNYAVLPSGAYAAYGTVNNQFQNDGGIRIVTDMSLCIQPQNVYGLRREAITTSNNGATINGNSNGVVNWATPSAAKILTPITEPTKYGVNSEQSFVGINIAKMIKTDSNNNKYFLNCSGLRVQISTDENMNSSVNKGRRVTHAFLGMTAAELAEESWFGDGNSYDYSGGISVNVGDYLEIGHSYAKSEAATLLYKKSDLYRELRNEIMKHSRAFKVVGLMLIASVHATAVTAPAYRGILIDETGLFYLTGVDTSMAFTSDAHTLAKPYVDELLRAASTVINLFDEHNDIGGWVNWINTSAKEYYNYLVEYRNTLSQLLGACSSVAALQSWCNNNAMSLYQLNEECLTSDSKSTKGLFSTSTYAYILWNRYAHDIYSDEYIGPEFNKPVSKFNDDGKVNVRLGAGLKGVNNRITVDIDNLIDNSSGLVNRNGTISIKLKFNGGLAINSSGELYVTELLQDLNYLQFICNADSTKSWIYDPMNSISSGNSALYIGEGLIMA